MLIIFPLIGPENTDVLEGLTAEYREFVQHVHVETFGLKVSDSCKSDLNLKTLFTES
jgi:hypothetical protein